MAASEIPIFRFVDTLNRPQSWQVDDFCTLIFSEMKDAWSVQVLEIRHYKEIDGLEHEFLLVQVEHVQKHHLLRIERSTPAHLRRTFWQKLTQTSSSILPALDTVSISSSFKKLTAGMNRGPIIHITTLLIPQATLTLHDFCLLLSLFPSFSPIYKLKEEQCYWFCDVVTSTISTMENIIIVHESGFKKARTYGRFHITVSAKARQLFIDGYKIIRSLQAKHPGEIDFLPDTAKTLVAMLTVPSDEAKTRALLALTSLARHSPEYQQMLLNADCIHQFSLIFLSSSIELKALIFVALDALGISDCNPLFDPLLYSEPVQLIEDTFADEDRKDIDIKYSNAAQDLTNLLKDARPTVSSRSAAAMAKFSWHKILRPLVLNSIPQMTQSRVNEVRWNALRIVTILARYPDIYEPLHEMILQAFPVLIRDRDHYIRIESLDRLRRIATTNALRFTAIKSFPLVSLLFLDNSETMTQMIDTLHLSLESTTHVDAAILHATFSHCFDDICIVGIKALSAVLELPVFHSIVISLLPRVFDLLKCKMGHVFCEIADFLSGLAMNIDLQHYVRASFSTTLNSFEDSTVRRAIIEFMGNAILNSETPPIFTQVTDLLADREENACVEIIGFLSDFATYSKLEHCIRPIAPKVLCLLEDRNLDVQASVIKFARKITSNRNFHPAVANAAPRILGLLKSRDSNIRQMDIGLLCDFIAYPGLRIYAQVAVPEICRLLKDSDSGVRASANEFLDKLIYKSSWYANKVPRTRTTYLSRHTM